MMKNKYFIRNVIVLGVVASLNGCSGSGQEFANSGVWWHGVLGAIIGTVLFLVVGNSLMQSDDDLREGHLQSYQTNYLALWAAIGTVVGGAFGYFFGNTLF